MLPSQEIYNFRDSETEVSAASNDSNISFTNNTNKYIVKLTAFTPDSSLNT